VGYKAVDEEKGAISGVLRTDKKPAKSTFRRKRCQRSQRLPEVVHRDHSQAAEITLPIDVEIDTGDVGGPSAGLAFALDVLEELGKEVDRGYKVAATGAIELDGRVLPIGGVKQKTIGARNSGVEVFLVPAGENAREAGRHAGRLRVIPVHNFRQALRALATLPPKR